MVTVITETLFLNVMLPRLLRAVQLGRAIQDWNTFLRLAGRGKEMFQYEVVFGDSGGVEKDIRAQPTNEQP